MSSIFSGVARRTGARGGKDQFAWENVASIKGGEKEFYLGQSLHCKPQGPFSRTADPEAGWWLNTSTEKKKSNKSKRSSEEERKAELKQIQEQEQILLRQQLGLAPKTTEVDNTRRLDKQDFQKLVERGQTGASRNSVVQSERIEGLGYAPFLGQNNQNISLFDGDAPVQIEAENAQNLTLDRNNTEDLRKSTKRRRYDSESDGEGEVERKRARKREQKLRKLEKKQEKKERKERKEKKGRKERKERKREKESRSRHRSRSRSRSPRRSHHRSSEHHSDRRSDRDRSHRR